MPSIPLHTRPATVPPNVSNPLPPLLHTPCGLTLIELQGTINMPDADPGSSSPSPGSQKNTHIGRLVFPADAMDPANSDWMKRVYWYVGKHQRLTGEVKKLPRPMAVIQRRQGTEDELEIVEIVKWKILFGGRPEPVGDVAMEDAGENAASDLV